MDVKKIGERIKHARSLRNYTLEDIAKDIGVAKSTIQRYERGQIAHPKLPVLHSIANSLNVNPGWLVGKDINMNADMDTKYSKYISDSIMVFEITGRSQLRAAGAPSADLPTAGLQMRNPNSEQSLAMLICWWAEYMPLLRNHQGCKHLFSTSCVRSSRNNSKKDSGCWETHHRP